MPHRTRDPIDTLRRVYTTMSRVNRDPGQPRAVLSHHTVPNALITLRQLLGGITNHSLAVSHLLLPPGIEITLGDIVAHGRLRVLGLASRLAKAR